ncbi:MAG: hypothetical protein DRZ80_02840 [Thermoprotei archaeon]|nr:MAG: hypothetical protein DRZ80_02840 [Thermoprotei archaeon]
MRILLASEWLSPDTGGVARHVDDLANLLVEKGYKVGVITRKKKERSKRKYMIFEVSRLNYLRLLSNVRGKGGVFEKLRAFQPDIVHAHHAFTPTPLFTLWAAKTFNLPAILTNHSAYFCDYEYLLKTIGYIGFPFRTFIEKADIIVSVSKISKNFIKHFTTKDVIVIPNGVNVTRFSPRVNGLRDQIDSDLVILYVSRIVRRKGPHLLVEALRYVRKRIPSVKLLIVGEGSFEEYLRRRVYDLDLRKNVEFLGRVPDEELPKIYNSADIFVLPSVYGESFGIVILEAMSSGLPVIVSNVGGLREIVKNNVDGIILDRNNPIEIYEKIMFLYHNKEFRNMLSYNARKKVLKLYDWRIILEKIENIYKRLIEEKASTLYAYQKLFN